MWGKAPAYNNDQARVGAKERFSGGAKNKKQSEAVTGAVPAAQLLGASAGGERLQRCLLPTGEERLWPN